MAQYGLFVLKLPLTNQPTNQPGIVVDDRKLNVTFCPEWSRVNDMHLKAYNDMLDDALTSINVPALLLGDKVANDISHTLIDRYYNDVLSCVITSLQIIPGCSIGGQFISVLVYADDLVLIAPSWRAMQNLLHILGDQASILDMTCNVQKTVCMMFQPFT